MRILPYFNDEDLEDIDTLTVIVKAVPFEDDYAPAFYISSPSDDYMMKIDELNCLMDGLEIARRAVDEIIDYILKSNMEEDD